MVHEQEKLGLRNLTEPNLGAVTGREPEKSATPAIRPEPQAAAPSDTLDFLWNVHKYINDYIRFADTKIAFVIAIATALIGALFKSQLHPLFINHRIGEWGLWAILSFLSFALLAIGILLGVWTVRPRLYSHEIKGVIYWGNICEHKSAVNYQTAVCVMSDNERIHALASHIFQLSEISKKKYFFLSLSVAASSFGALIAGLVLLFNR